MEKLNGQDIVRVLDVNIDNCCTLVGNYSLGTKDAKVTYKLRKQYKKIILMFADIEIDVSDEDINKYLSRYKLVEIKQGG